MVKAGYKQTEVGEIPEDWDASLVGNHVQEISMGPFGSDIKVSNFKSVGVPVLSGDNLRSHRLKDGFKNFLTPEKAKSLNKAVARRGDVIVTHRGTLGQIAFIPKDSQYEEYVISQSQFRVRFKAELNPAWGALYFLSRKGADALLEGKGHTGVPAIAQATTTFRKLFIPLPPIDEQNRIVETLSEVDALIVTLEKLIEKKRDIKTATMQQLLTGKKRLPGFGEGKGTKQTELGEIPEDWELKEISKVAPLQRGFDLPTRLVKIGEYPVAYSNGIQNYHSEYLVKGPGVFTGRSGTIGKVHYVESNYWPHNTSLWVTDFKGNIPKYIFYMLSYIGLGRFGGGSGVPTLNRNDVHGFIFCIPDAAEQRAISNVLSDIDIEIAVLESRLSKTKALKQGMMQELLTGRTRLL